jgi:conjugal transfer pilus assembly protein TraA
MKFNEKSLAALAAGLAAMVAMEPALATAVTTTTAVSTDAFDSFRDTIISWTQGPLGVGLAVTMMLMGAGIGVAKNSPMPALSGIGGAAFLTWGPDIIDSMMGSAAVLPGVL